MRAVLKKIAGFRNPSAVQEKSQAAAKLAQELLEDLNLFYEVDIGE